MDIQAENDFVLQMFFSTEAEGLFSEENSVKTFISGSDEYQKAICNIPTDSIKSIRFDFGEEANILSINSMKIVSGEKIQQIPLEEIKGFRLNQIEEIYISDNNLIITSSGNDPYIWSPYEFSADKEINMIYLVPMFLCVFVILFFLAKPVTKYLLVIYRSRMQIISLAISDFKSRFSGSYFGVAWGIIQPLMTIVLFWFVFQVGFRTKPIDNVPFILWLIAGMIPWNFFSDAWFNGTSTYTNYSYIVKKLVFNIDLLTVVRIAASSILNIIFNVIMIVIYTAYGFFPGIHIVDMIYFSFCLIILSYALSVITATLNVFMKDIGQLLGIVMQFLMWMTPMMWTYTMIPEKYSWFYKLNPLHYVINGYREALINKQWFFNHFYQMIWFWVITLVLLIIGNRLYNKLKIHFADVL
jgi:teichoic acid transport system permease protein